MGSNSSRPKRRCFAELECCKKEYYIFYIFIPATVWIVDQKGAKAAIKFNNYALGS
jgi:hypothetical protein